MTISPINNSYGNYYGTGRTSAGYGAAGSTPSVTITEDAPGKIGKEPFFGRERTEGGADKSGRTQLSGSGRTEDGTDKSGRAQLSGKEREDWKKKMGIEDPTEECQTCKNRKYKDGSDEMVSFKTPQHVSPENAASAVRAHEQEHVSNAYKKAATDNGKVISASVSIHMAVCPECGRTYVSGGTTHTQIKYYNEENPYQQDLKSADRAKYAGMNLDYAV